jgi:methyltransferase-like protein
MQDLLETYMDSIINEVDQIINEIDQGKIDKEIQRNNQLFSKKLDKYDSILIKLRKATKAEVISMTGLLGNHIAEKNYGGAYVMTLFDGKNTDKKIGGPYLTCKFTSSDLDSNIRSKIKIQNN